MNSKTCPLCKKVLLNNTALYERKFDTDISVLACEYCHSHRVISVEAIGKLIDRYVDWREVLALTSGYAVLLNPEEASREYQPASYAIHKNLYKERTEE